MATTIQISTELRKKLEMRKAHEKESYESIIWDLLEDNMELSEQAKKDIAQSRKQIAAGNFKTLAQVKKELGF